MYVKIINKNYKLQMTSLKISVLILNVGNN